MKFFVDNNLSARIAKGLNAFVAPEHSVLHLRERFAATTDDVDWMRELAKEEGWCVITADISIGKNPHEIAAWKQAGHTIFFLKRGWLKMNFWEQAHKFVKCFPEIIKTAERAKRGESFLVLVNGRIER